MTDVKRSEDYIRSRRRLWLVIRYESFGTQQTVHKKGDCIIEGSPMTDLTVRNYTYTVTSFFVTFLVEKQCVHQQLRSFYILM